MTPTELEEVRVTTNQEIAQWLDMDGVPDFCGSWDLCEELALPYLLVELEKYKRARIRLEYRLKRFPLDGRHVFVHIDIPRRVYLQGGSTDEPFIGPEDERWHVAKPSWALAQAISSFIRLIVFR